MFPGGRPPSIFGAKKLNFCVRDGNRCDLLAIATYCVEMRCAYFTFAIRKCYVCFAISPFKSKANF